MELENNEEGNGKGNKKRIAIIAVVVAALIAYYSRSLKLGHFQRHQHVRHVQWLL